LANADTSAIGRVIEVLGDPDDFGVDVEMMIRKHQLPRMFPRTCWPKRAPWHILTSLKSKLERIPWSSIVTIDGETARDFDDLCW